VGSRWDTNFSSFYRSYSIPRRISFFIHRSFNLFDSDASGYESVVGGSQIFCFNFSFSVSVLWQRRADRASFSPGRHCHTTIRGPDWILLLFHRRPCSTDVDDDEVHRLRPISFDRTVVYALPQYKNSRSRWSVVDGSSHSGPLFLFFTLSVFASFYPTTTCRRSCSFHSPRCVYS